MTKYITLAYTLVDRPDLTYEETVQYVYNGLVLNELVDAINGITYDENCQQILNLPSKPVGPIIFDLSPNPADDSCRLFFSLDHLPRALHVYDTVGKLIFSARDLPQFFYLPTANWPIGTYFVETDFGLEKRVKKLSVWH